MLCSWALWTRFLKNNSCDPYKAGHPLEQHRLLWCWHGPNVFRISSLSIQPFPKSLCRRKRRSKRNRNYHSGLKKKNGSHIHRVLSPVGSFYSVLKPWVGKPTWEFCLCWNHPLQCLTFLVTSLIQKIHLIPQPLSFLIISTIFLIAYLSHFLPYPKPCCTNMYTSKVYIHVKPSHSRSRHHFFDYLRSSNPLILPHFPVHHPLHDLS